MNTVSLEVAKKLKEAGLNIDSGYVWDLSYDDKWELVHSWEHGGYHPDGNSTNAYQMHEILEQLPCKIKFYENYAGGEVSYFLDLGKYATEGVTTYELCYVNNEYGMSCGEQLSENPHDAVALLWIWLKENGCLDDNNK